MVGSVGDDSVYPVFINGQKVGVASSVQYQQEVDTSELGYGRNIVATSATYTFGFSGRNFDSSISNVRADKLTSVAIGIPNGANWRMVTFQDAFITNFEVSGQYILAEGTSSKMSVTTMDSLGPDVGAPETYDTGFESEMMEDKGSYQKPRYAPAESTSNESASNPTLDIDDSSDFTFKVQEQ